MRSKSLTFEETSVTPQSKQETFVKRYEICDGRWDKLICLKTFFINSKSSKTSVKIYKIIIYKLYEILSILPTSLFCKWIQFFSQIFFYLTVLIFVTRSILVLSVSL